MKSSNTFAIFAIIATVCLGSANAFAAGNVTNHYIVSVKDNKSELVKARGLLTLQTSMKIGSVVCHATTKADGNPILSNTPGYVEDRLISITSNCREAADIILKTWEQSKTLEVYPDGTIEPFPAVSGGS